LAEIIDWKPGISPAEFVGPFPGEDDLEGVNGSKATEICSHLVSFITNELR
jgi:hypothetical protein